MKTKPYSYAILQCSESDGFLDDEGKRSAPDEHRWRDTTRMHTKASFSGILRIQYNDHSKQVGESSLEFHHPWHVHGGTQVCVMGC